MEQFYAFRPDLSLGNNIADLIMRWNHHIQGVKETAKVNNLTCKRSNLRQYPLFDCLSNAHKSQVFGRPLHAVASLVSVRKALSLESRWPIQAIKRAATSFCALNNQSGHTSGLLVPSGGLIAEGSSD